ncbi:hypothetical protein Tco_0260037 [Tanacetum coccineum]
MERDCQHGLYKAGMGSSRVLSDFAEKYGSKNRVLAGFGIGGKSGKEKTQIERINKTWSALSINGGNRCISSSSIRILVGTNSGLIPWNVRKIQARARFKVLRVEAKFGHQNKSIRKANLGNFISLKISIEFVDLFITLNTPLFINTRTKDMEEKQKDLPRWTGCGTLLSKKGCTWSFVTSGIGFTTEERRNGGPWNATPLRVVNIPLSLL